MESDKLNCMRPRPNVRRIAVLLDADLYRAVVSMQHRLELPTLTHALHVLLKKGILALDEPKRKPKKGDR
jgi:hypothetical protein